ncbi:unnamed protein product [Amaranthus hypochondriacus]
MRFIRRVDCTIFINITVCLVLVRRGKNTSGSRTDPGWEHCIEVDKVAKKVKCKYCSGVRSGGIFRHKHHLACTDINVEGCLQVPDDVKYKFRALLEATSEASSAKRKKINDIGEEECESRGNQRVRGATKENQVVSN